ncbi:MAG: SIR2 family protein [Planctomycetes bacterium]|nr:SIR2 family protein [Planctomycetota bacterium]
MKRDSLDAEEPRVVVRRLEEIAARGERLVPLLGSGISALSGIMMGQSFTDYLATAIHDAVGHSESQNVGRVGRLAEGVWSQSYTEADIRLAREWVEQRIRDRVRDVAVDLSIPELAARYSDYLASRSLADATSPFTTDHLVEQGVGSLRDWRSALTFLARLYVKDEVVRLREDASQIVIDSFVTQLVAKRMPNLTHKMIAHIAVVMNVRLLLTTNFDDLIERSFQALQRELRVVEVPLGARLPPASSFALGRALVKLHGGLIQVRADASLDARPTQEDIEAFMSYLSPGSMLAPNDGPTWLLVLGYSGSDRRLIDMLKAAVRMRPQVRVIWVAHTASDVAHANRIFSEPSMRELIDPGRFRRVHFAQCSRPDLMLYEAYQRMTRSLPPGGLTYRFAYKLPPTIPLVGSTGGREDARGVDDPTIVETVDAVLAHLSANHEHPLTVRADGRRLGILLRRCAEIPNSWTLVVGGSGALRISVAVFERLEQASHRMWFEMQEYSSFGMFLLDVVRTLAIRSGVFEQELLVTPDARLLAGGAIMFERRLMRLVRRMRVIPSDWMLFLYARDQMGGSATWSGTAWAEEDNEQLKSLLQVLGRIGFRSLIIPITPSRVARNREKVREIQALFERGDRRRPGVDAIWTELVDVLREYPDLLPQPPTDARAAAAAAERHGEDILRCSLPAAIGATGREFAVGKLTDELAGALRTHGREPFVASEQDDEFVRRSMPGGAGAHAESRGSSEVVRRGGLSYRQYIARVLAWIHAPTKEKYDTTLRRQKFIYAISLFLQSRHECAFYSEAVFPCPFPFNLESIDNDVTRGLLVDGWLRQLERLGIIYRRQGGFFWLHRDVRLGLQAILGECRARYGESAGREAGDDDVCERETRARTHFWIARWYLRSFLASQHTVPLWSCVYHNLQCALYAAYDRPTSPPDSGDALNRYRRHLVDMSLRDTLRVLVLGRRSAKYWLNSADLKGFRQAIEIMTEPDGPFSVSLRKLFDATPDKKNARSHRRTLEQLVAAVIEEFEALNTSIAAECGKALSWRVDGDGLLGADPKSVPSGSDESVASRPRFGKALRVPGRFLQLAHSDRPMPTARWSFERPEFYEPDSGSRRFLSQFETPLSELGLRWVWKAVMKCLQVDVQKYGTEKPLEHRREKDLRRQAEWLEKWRGRQMHVLAAVKLMNEMAYALTRRAKVLLWSCQSGDAARDTDRQWLAAAWLTHHSVDLTRSLIPEYLGDDAVESEKALTLYGLALAGLRRFSEARRRIGEARSILAITANQHGPRNAVLLLRSAEVFVLEAGRLAGGSEPIDDACRQRAESKLALAWLSLEDAEAKLSGTSHSTLWWGLLYRLRLSIAGLLWQLRPDPTGPGLVQDPRVQVSDSQLNELVWTWVIRGLAACGNSGYRRVRIVSAFLGLPITRRRGFVELEISLGSPIWEAIEEASPAERDDAEPGGNPRVGAQSIVAVEAERLRRKYKEWVRPI